MEFLKKHILTQNWISIFLIIALVGAVSYPIFWHRIMTPTDNDYGAHIQFAMVMLRKQMPPTYSLAHPIVQIILGGVYWLTRGRIGLWEGMVTLMVLSNIFTALILYAFLREISEKGSEVIRVVLALTFPFIAPIPGLAPLDGLYYFGYIGLANYHNPTVQLLKPLALIVFMLAMRIFDGKSYSNQHILLSALLVIITSLVKQNLIISLVPALVLLMVLAWWRNWAVNIKLGVFGFVIPSVLILMVQTYVTFLMPEADKGGFIFAPLVVESAFSDFLFLKFLLSILFPLITLLLFTKPILENREMQLAWLAFLAGIGQLYLFAESGSRIFDGNFRWSAQITLMLLFASTLRFLLSQMKISKISTHKRGLISLFAYFLHVVGGVIYYIVCMLSTHYG